MTKQNETKEVISRVCRFPGCEQPAAQPVDGVGRPPAYCTDPAHTRAAAFRARRDAEAAPGTDKATPAPAEEPVTFARVRAGMLVERVEAAVEALATMTADVVGELRTLGDVEAVEVELESVSASAEQRAAEARALAAEAETRRRRADAAATEAEQMRAEAEAAAEEALVGEAEAHEAVKKAELATSIAQEENESLKAEMATLLNERDSALTKAREQGEQLLTAQADLVQAKTTLAEQITTVENLTKQLTAQTTRCERAETELAQLQHTFNEQERTVMQLQATADEQRTAMALTQARVEEITNQRDQLSAKTTECDGQLRVRENDNATARAEIAALKAQLNTVQSAADLAATLAERTANERIAELRELYEARITELRKQG